MNDLDYEQSVAILSGSVKAMKKILQECGSRGPVAFQCDSTRIREFLSNIDQEQLVIIGYVAVCQEGVWNFQFKVTSMEEAI